LDIFAGAETEGVMEEIQQQTQKEEQKHREEEEEEEEGPPPGWESAVLPPPIVTITAAVNPNPTTVEIPEKAQMVCGSCRRLLSYLRGSKHVKCSSCQTVNLVLEGSFFHGFFISYSLLEKLLLIISVT
jgi:LSD1 subclass zinc finger protein